ncbi:MAG: hypothetical protein ACOYNR_07945 [Blastocatellia bacterium]|jgi:hypothetical protein
MGRGEERLEGLIEVQPSRRLCLVLDSATQNRVLLQAAVHLAVELGAELEGMLIEDETLHRLAAQSDVAHVSRQTTLAEPLSVARLEREWRAQARLLRDRLTELAAHEQVVCHFRVVRGRLEREILAAAAEAEHLALWGATPLVAQLHEALDFLLVPPIRLPRATASPVQFPSRRPPSSPALPRRLPPGSGGILLLSGQSGSLRRSLLEELLRRHGSHPILLVE